MMLSEHPGRDSSGQPMNIGRASPYTPLAFCVLVFALSLPLWLIGAITDVQLFPGLPLAALGAVCPLIAALILVWIEGKAAAVIALLKRLLDYRQIRAKAWYGPILLLMPCVTVVSYALLRLQGRPLPTPQVSVLVASTMFLVFLIGALCEELGWSGYATDPLLERASALSAAILLGLVWAVWHFIPLLQAHRPLAWIAWWSLFTVALRILIVWIYNNTGKSVFAAALIHAMSNVCTMLLPAYFELIAPILAVVAAVVTVVWGPRTLTRHKGR
jgi:membrane protease YdiL (CAAX protease family)